MSKFDKDKMTVEDLLAYIAEGTDDRIRAWEWEWVNSIGGFNSEPEGNTIDISKQLYNKYKDIL